MSTDVNRLINQVKSENDRWLSRLNLYRLIISGAFVVWIIYLMVSLHSHSHLSPLTHSGFLVLGVIFGQEGLGLLSRPTILHRESIQTLTQIEETVAVGPLLESMHPAWVAGSHVFRSDSKLYYTLIDALTRLLPRLTEAEYRTLVNREKKALYTMLSSEYEEVALPAMEGVTRLNDRGAMRILEKVARRRARTEIAHSLREAAKISLGRLQQAAGA